MKKKAEFWLRTIKPNFTFAAMKITGFLAVVFLLAGCASMKSGKNSDNLLWINSAHVDCTGSGQQKCLQIQRGTKLGDEWENFYGYVEGFEYQPGFIYQIEVNKTELPKDQVPADGGSIKYELVKVISKTPDLKEDGLYVHLQTSLGDIIGKLAYDKAPLTVANFVGLAEGTIENTAKPAGEPYFDSLTFHRVIPDFMIQGGDPSGNGSGGPGYKFKNETHPDLKHDKPGVFSMANAGPNTNGSQFFITHKATPFLDGNYSVFGQVIAGQDIVVAIADVPRRASDRPKTPVYMTDVNIIRVGSDAKSFDAAATFKKLK